MSYSESDIARFWEKVDRRGPDECWPWIASTHHRHPYGQFGHGGTMKVASRVSFEIEKGPLPPGHEACHSCDNPRCCNPRHLFAGTHLENMRDRDRKGRTRNGVSPGEKNGRAVVTAEQVNQIRERYAAGGINLTNLGALFGLGKSQVHNIVKHRCWKPGARIVISVLEGGAL